MAKAVSYSNWKMKENWKLFHAILVLAQLLIKLLGINGTVHLPRCLKLVGLDKNSIKNSSCQQSNLPIQATKMKWSETNYLPGLRILPSSITFKFDNMNPRNEDYVSSQEFIMNWIVITETEMLLWCNIELRTIGLLYNKY